jgi:head-tail adaptor
MKAGQFSTFVHILAPGTTVDAHGQPEVSWTFVADDWVNVAFAPGLRTAKESVAAGAEVSAVKASVRMRARDDITLQTGMRLQAGAALFDIIAVPPVLSGVKTIDLQCEVARHV